MTPELDTDAIEAVPLDSTGFDCALEAATESNTAGQDAQEQMRWAVRAYLWATRPRRTKNNDDIGAHLKALLERGITDAEETALTKRLKDAVDNLEEDLLYRVKDNMAPYILDWVERMASDAVEQMLAGNESQMRRYLHCDKPYDSIYNGRQDGYHGGRDVAGQHPIIHGEMSSASCVELRKKLVDAHADVLISERILDLEDQLASVTAQYNKVHQEKEAMGQRLRNREYD